MTVRAMYLYFLKISVTSSRSISPLFLPASINYGWSLLADLTEMVAPAAACFAVTACDKQHTAFMAAQPCFAVCEEQHKALYQQQGPFLRPPFHKARNRSFTFCCAMSNAETLPPMHLRFGSAPLLRSSWQRKRLFSRTATVRGVYPSLDSWLMCAPWSCERSQGRQSAAHGWEI